MSNTSVSEFTVAPMPAIADGALVGGTFGKFSNDGTGLSVATCATDEDPDCIICEDTADGLAVGVATEGFGVMTVDGSGDAIAAGDLLTVGTAGVGIKAPDDEGAAYGAQALEPATTAGASIRVRVLRGFDRPAEA